MAHGNTNRATRYICNLSNELDFLDLPPGHTVDAEHRLGGAAVVSAARTAAGPRKMDDRCR